MKKLYECLPVGERAWLARVAFIAAAIWITAVVSVAITPTTDDMHPLSDTLADTLGADALAVLDLSTVPK